MQGTRFCLHLVCSIVMTVSHRDASPLRLQDPLPVLQQQCEDIQGRLLCLLAGGENIAVLHRVVWRCALQRPADQGVGERVSLRAAVQWAVLRGKHFPKVSKYKEGRGILACPPTRVPGFTVK